MHIVFFSTSDVFRAEEILTEVKIDCKVVPTPVTDKAYCGVCIQTSVERALMYLSEMEYSIVE